LHIEDVNQLVGCSVWLSRAKRLICKLRKRRLIVRRLHHAIELGLLPALGGGLQLAGAAAELPGQGKGLLNFERPRCAPVAMNVAHKLLDVSVSMLRGFTRSAV
jgi:hypothetical protein